LGGGGVICLKMLQVQMDLNQIWQVKALLPPVHNGFGSAGW